VRLLSSQLFSITFCYPPSARFPVLGLAVPETAPEAHAEIEGFYVFFFF